MRSHSQIAGITVWNYLLVCHHSIHHNAYPIRSKWTLKWGSSSGVAEGLHIDRGGRWREVGMYVSKGPLDSGRIGGRTEFSSVQSHSLVWLFGTPWTAASQASLSITNSPSLLKLMSIELVLQSNHLIPCHPLLLPSIFPSIRVFSKESGFTSGGQSIGVSASASVIPMNIQGWFPLGWTGWISLQSKGL